MRVVIPTADQLLMRAMMRACRGLEAVPPHTKLVALAREGVASALSGGKGGDAIERLPTQLAALERRTAALAAEPAVAVAARTANPNAWARAQSLLEESRNALASSRSRAESLAARGDRALRTALESGARALGVEERTLATSVMDEALKSIGCRTTVAEGAGTSGIWAERGDHLVAVLIEDGGKVELDHAGCGGDRCAPFHQEIEAAVAAHGGTFENSEIVEHGDPAGGVLIRNAALAAGPRGDIARAIADQAVPERPPRFSRRTGQEAPDAQRVTSRSGS